MSIFPRFNNLPLELRRRIVRPYPIALAEQSQLDS